MAKQGAGLKSMRKVSGNKPTHQCDNCKCMRYSLCGCTKKMEKEGSE